MNICPACYAASPDSSSPPHGDGVPCPHATELREAMIKEMEAKTELLRAQRDATLKAPKLR